MSERAAVSTATSTDAHRFPTRSFRILFVLEYFPPHIGGVETMFYQLTKALAAAGCTVTVVTLKIPGTKARETCDGITIVRVPAPQGAKRAFFTLLAVPFVLREAFRADIIHAATPSSALSAWIAAWITRRPAVHTVHEVFAELLPLLPGLHPARVRAFRIYEQFIFRLPFAHYICDSQFTRKRLIRLTNVPEQRTSVAYPMVDHSFWERARHAPRDLRAQLGFDERSFLYLYFGRPGYLKGVEYLIDAAAQIREQLPSSRLVMLLDHDPPDHYQRLRQRISRSGLDDHVIILDPAPRAELPGYLLAADCVVIPSVSEGFGYAAVEATTLGCRVVATAGHAVEEVLAGYATFVPPRDGAALAKAIVAIASESSPSAPSPPPPRFTVEGHVETISAIYARLVPRARQPRHAKNDRRYV